MQGAFGPGQFVLQLRDAVLQLGGVFFGGLGLILLARLHQLPDGAALVVHLGKLRVQHVLRAPAVLVQLGGFREQGIGIEIAFGQAGAGLVGLAAQVGGLQHGIGFGRTREGKLLGDRAGVMLS